MFEKWIGNSRRSLKSNAFKEIPPTFELQDNFKSRTSRNQVSTAAKYVFIPLMLAWKEYTAKEKKIIKVKKTASIRHKEEEKKNTASFFCIHSQTPSIGHFLPISPTFLSGMLTSLLCISQPNRIWHRYHSDKQEKPIIMGAMTCTCLRPISSLSHYTEQVLMQYNTDNTWKGFRADLLGN